MIRASESKGAEVFEAEKKFVPGKFRADVLVYQLDSAKYLGGFIVEAAHAQKIEVADDDDPENRFDSNLSAEVFVALDDGARKHIPGSLPPR